MLDRLQPRRALLRLRDELEVQPVVLAQQPPVLLPQRVHLRLRDHELLPRAAREEVLAILLDRPREVAVVRVALLNRGAVALQAVLAVGVDRHGERVPLVRVLVSRSRPLAAPAGSSQPGWPARASRSARRLGVVPCTS